MNALHKTFQAAAEEVFAEELADLPPARKPFGELMIEKNNILQTGLFELWKEFRAKKDYEMAERIYDLMLKSLSHV